MTHTQFGAVRIGAVTGEGGAAAMRDDGARRPGQWALVAVEVMADGSLLAWPPVQAVEPSSGTAGPASLPAPGPDPAATPQVPQACAAAARGKRAKKRFRVYPKHLPGADLYGPQGQYKHVRYMPDY